jgi:hypothetical protein
MANAEAEANAANEMSAVFFFMLSAFLFDDYRTVKTVPNLLDENFWRENSALVQMRDSKPPTIDAVRLDAHTLFVAGTSSPQNGIVSAAA